MSATDTSGPDAELVAPALAAFTAARPRLFGIAYRMLGTVQDAEDLLQEVWVRWQGVEFSTVDNPAGFLTTITTRLAITALQSARVRRETYVGPWLPEPVDTTSDPLLGAERDAALDVAVLVLLERLGPAERAAYVLREAFAFPYAEIGKVLDTTEASARQWVSRARKHVAAERQAAVDPLEQRRLLTAFVAAARDGDLDRLLAVFTDDVVSWSDSGGRARAARIPVRGALTVAKFVRAFSSHYWVGADISWQTVNGTPAAVLGRGGTVFAVLTVAASQGGIEQLLWQMNPEKLALIENGQHRMGEPVEADGVGLTGGNMEPVIRIGDTVRRIPGAWTPAVHALLDAWQAAGIAETPRALGLDERGREVVSYLDGDVLADLPPEFQWDTDILAAAGSLLRRMHDASVRLVDLTGAQWRQPPHPPLEVVCHNDVAPYNLVVRDGSLSGIIDVDMASPGSRLWDFAYLAYRTVPWVEEAEAFDPTRYGTREERLAWLTSAYGMPFAPSAVREAAAQRLDELAAFTDQRAADTGRDDVLAHAAMYRRDAVRLRG